MIEAVGGGVRVALDEVHVLDVDAHLVGHDLGHGRLDALPVAAGAHVHVDLAAGLDPDRGRRRSRRAAPGCGSMYRDSPMPSRRPSARACFLVLAELLVADQLGRLLQALLRADALVHHRHRVGVGQLGPGDHVTAAELQRVDAQLVRDDVDHLLPAGGLHHPRAPVRAVPARVRVDRLPGVRHRTRGRTSGTARGRPERPARPSGRCSRSGRRRRSRCGGPWPASSTPFSSVAAVISSDSSRAWPPLIRFSARSSIHFTGRSPRSMAAITTACSSRVGNRSSARRSRRHRA